MREITIVIKRKNAKKYIGGYPLISDGIKNEEEGTIIRYVDENDNFIARGYKGSQNKGEGWIVSLDKSEKVDYTLFKNRIKTALNERLDLFNDESTTAFRVFNNEGDGIGGMTIDYFDGYYLINWYNYGLYQFRDEIVEALKDSVEYKGIYEKRRFGGKGKYMDYEEFVCGTEASFPIIAKENDVKFAIYFNDGAMVGVFLDQREVRKTIRDKYSEGKTVLNTFSYTGAFSIFAAKGGSIKTTSVDLANRSREKTKEHFQINDLDNEGQDIIVEDVFNYFKYAVKKEKKFDLVILDPPSFAKSKKFKFSASKDYKDLLKNVIKITEDDGVIVASTNCATFNMHTFKEFIDDAFYESNKGYEIVEEFTLPTDFKTNEKFKEGNYLKVCFIKIK